MRGLFTSWAVLSAGVAMVSCGGGERSKPSASNPGCDAGECAGTGNEAGSGSTMTSGAGGGGTGGTVRACETRRDCDDGKYCNGDERCAPDDPDADAEGCVAAEEVPCDGAACDEATESCVACSESGDIDGDGAPSAECAEEGEEPDCDDNDDARFPGNTEVCDADNVDEDCDPETLGGPEDSDKDDDGHVDIACCNEDEDGDLVCGDDCNDEKSGINPSEPEACNDIDDNCDGEVDTDENGDTLKTPYYRDEDGDGYGVVSTRTMACAPPDPEGTEQWVDAAGDCADDVSLEPEAAAINPGADEDCDQPKDENCSGVADEGCSCLGEETRPCGPFEEDGTTPLLLDDGETPNTRGICKQGFQACDDGTWSAECTDWQGPEEEVCNLKDDDCDGTRDLDPESGEYLGDNWVLDEDGDNWGVDGTLEQACDPPGSNYSASSNLGDCEDDPTTNANAKNINPARAELCNGYDDDCDGIVDGDSSDGDLKVTYWRDQDLDTYGTHTNQADYCAGSAPSGWVLPPEDSSNEDCNDKSGSVHPNATEICNGVDDDCANGVDDDLEEPTPAHTSEVKCAGTSGWEITDCSGSWLQCDSDVSNGCETPGNTLSDCGSCDNQCSFSCGGSDCDDIASFELGTEHSCAVTSSGLATCWGRNNEGRIGDNSTTLRSSPVELTTFTAAVSAISAGTDHTCAIAGASNTAYCWGSNSNSKMGPPEDGQPGGTAGSLIPLIVQNVVGGGGGNLTSVSAIAAGNEHTCAVYGGGGLVACWGLRDDYRLANGLSSGSSQPISAFRDPSSPTVIDDATTVVAGWAHSCIINGDNTVECWGDNSVGQVGNGMAPADPIAAVDVLNLTDVTAISAGNFHTCAIASGDLYCWGDNGSGQLGVDTSTTSSSDTPVLALTNVTAVAAGGASTCVITTDSKVYCWGDNSSGQRGDTNYGTATHVPQLLTTIVGPADIAAGAGHACVRMTALDEVRCWGSNTGGQLGIGNSDLNPHSTPTAIDSL